MSDWIILRCSGASTLPLAKSLAEAGFSVWTPVERVVVRAGESRTRKKDIQAMTPEWVFAKANHLAELLALTHAPAMVYQAWDADKRQHIAKGHPYFRLLKDGDHFAMVDDRALAYLRLEERKDKPKQKAREFAPGEAVRVTDGAFEGMTGIVESVRAPYVSVLFPRSNYVPKLPFWLLALVEPRMEKAA